MYFHNFMENYVRHEDIITIFSIGCGAGLNKKPKPVTCCGVVSLCTNIWTEIKPLQYNSRYVNILKVSIFLQQTEYVPRDRGTKFL